MTEVVTKEKCCGCSACAQVCPRECISMREDAQGFLYPEIDSSRCVDCRLCQKTCPVQAQRNPGPANAYLAYCREDSVRKTSSSGGIFTLLAEEIWKNKGKVCAAVYGEAFRVEHIVTEDASQIGRMRKSKYMQSDLKNCFCEIKASLEAEKEVLFVGTPCQTAGLRKYLKKDYSGLFCVDIVCHGVPSYKVFQKYIADTFPGRKLSHVDFRDKTTGWKNYSVTFSFSDGGTERMKRERCLYFNGFVQNLFLRPSCYHCQFKDENYESDLTLGDFWGIERIFPEKDDDKGAGLVLVHTNKGEQLLTSLKSRIYLEKVSGREYIQRNPSICLPAAENPKRGEFFEQFTRYSFPVLWDYVHTESALQKLKMKLKYRRKT